MLSQPAAADDSVPADAPPAALWERCLADPRLEAKDEPEDFDYGPGPGMTPELRRALRKKKAARPEELLAEICPELHAGLAASRLAPFLPPDWDRAVTAPRLARLRDLLPMPAPAAGRRPDPAAVAGVLASIRDAEVERHRSLWQRFRDWVKGLLDRRAGKESSNWLTDWLREHFPSERVITGIMTVLVFVLVGLVAWIVYVELRAAGLLRRERQARAAAAGALPAAGGRRPTLAEASEAELPGLLIALLLEQLRRLGRVEDRGSMTHRELLRAARFERGTERDAFHGLVAASEQLRYAPVAPEPGSLRGIVESARRLLESLARETRSAT